MLIALHSAQDPLTHAPIPIPIQFLQLNLRNRISIAQFLNNLHTLTTGRPIFACLAIVRYLDDDPLAFAQFLRVGHLVKILDLQLNQRLIVLQAFCVEAASELFLQLQAGVRVDFDFYVAEDQHGFGEMLCLWLLLAIFLSDSFCQGTLAVDVEFCQLALRVMSVDLLEVVVPALRVDFHNGDEGRFREFEREGVNYLYGWALDINNLIDLLELSQSMTITAKPKPIPQKHPINLHNKDSKTIAVPLSNSKNGSIGLILNLIAFNTGQQFNGLRNRIGNFSPFKIGRTHTPEPGLAELVGGQVEDMEVTFVERLQGQFSLEKLLFVVLVNLQYSHSGAQIDQLLVLHNSYNQYCLYQQSLILFQLLKYHTAMQKEQLSNLLHQSDTMTQELIALRNAVLNNSLGSSFEKSSETLIKAIHHRAHLRTLAETLEANRNLVQIKKQKIEKSRIVLQGLDYFKKTLKDKIQAYHTDVDTIDDYLESPVGHIDWENDYESGQARLKNSLQKLKAKDQVYRSTIGRKNEMLKAMEEKNKLYNVVMPKHIKKLTDQVQEVSKIFGIEANEQLQQIENPQLAYIFDSFQTLRVVEKIDVKYSREQHETVDVVLKPVTLELYQRAFQYNIKLEEKELKIKICSLKPDCNKLVIGVDRRSDFSNRDLFHRLINHEDIKSVIEDPSIESHRNLNNKFVVVNWLEESLSVSAVKCSARMFAIALVKYLLDSVKNPLWLSNVAPHVYNEIVQKKFSIESVHKISFNDFKQMVSLPNSIRKSLNAYEQQKLRKEMTAEQEQEMRKNKNKLLQVLATFGVQELVIPDLYSYHKAIISYKGQRVTCIIMIPFEYPNTAPKIKAIQWQGPTEPETPEALPQSIECKAKLTPKAGLNRHIEALEKSANLPFSPLNEGLNGDPFRLVYYLSKLFSEFYTCCGNK